MPDTIIVCVGCGEEFLATGSIAIGIPEQRFSLRRRAVV
jgi:hypothetical protein